MKKNGGSESGSESDNHPSGGTKTPPVSKGSVKQIGTTVPLKGGTGDAYKNPT